MLILETAFQIKPQAGPQTAFLSNAADIAIYGGSAGGGKSYALLLEPLRHIHNKNFGGVIFRRTLADVKKTGSLLDTSMNIYGAIGGKLRQDNFSWKFNEGAKISFGHLEHETTVLDWQGAQIPYLGFDELTHFSRKMFFYMLSRNRAGACRGIKPYVRATTNPDADSWVRELIDWWIDPATGLPIQERSGIIRWFARINDELLWADSKLDLQWNHPGCEPKSLTFIPAKLEDNAILMQTDPDYRANLMALDSVERARLLGGNWNIRPAAGLYFQRRWCEVVDEIPIGTNFVRGWDLAATAKTDANDPDWTAGTKIGKCPDGRFIVAHHLRLRESSAGVERAVKNTASDDGLSCRIHIPQDPGQAGKAQVAQYSKLLEAFNVRFQPAGTDGSKVVRFGPFSAQAEAGNVLVLRGAWNELWFTQLEAFPDGKHDDDVDSTSEAYNALTAKDDTGIIEFYKRQMEEAKATKEQGRPLNGPASDNPTKWTF
jgi:predicted phage terminase large subunit-like protein